MTFLSFDVPVQKDINDITCLILHIFFTACKDIKIVTPTYVHRIGHSTSLTIPEGYQ